MNDALYISATGMKAQAAQLEVVANNVANVSTPAYKRSQLRFGDLMAPIAPGQEPEVGKVVGGAGQGVALLGETRSFAAGELKKTDDPMALAIQGMGFLEVMQADGTPAFSRGGHLELNNERLLSTAGGLALRPRIHVPTDTHQVTIQADGEVWGVTERGQSFQLGRLDLVTFSQPAGLRALGGGLWQATSQSGEAVVTPASEGGTGRLVQGYQEGSNVQLVDEMVQLMVAQRAYEMNVKILQAADEVAAMTNNLRK